MSNARRPLPTEKQIAWADMEFGMFCHFGLNTFSDLEWGEGEESPELFNPTELDPMQWAQTAREAGMRYIVVTAKHHEGFCIWQTDTTDYSVASSPWQDGDGDVIRLVAQACEAHDLKLGIYCSPWDRHEPCYEDNEAYDDFYIQQWTELLTRYGEVSCIWLDGAGSAGHVYDWERIIGSLRELQPGAAVFSMGDPDYRWVGNEDGLAADPCWNVVTPDDINTEHLTQEYMAGFPHWLPAECDARIRENWFWHAGDADSLKSTGRLVDMYIHSVGRGCNLLLNVGPDDRGLLPQADVARLQEMRAELHRRFSTPAAQAQNPAESPQVDFERPTAISAAISAEDIARGERVREYVVQFKRFDRWEAACIGKAIGHKKIDTFPSVVADSVRLHVLKSDAEPCFKTFKVF
ncbi:MAG: alpha-L-fucosidase [Armatimonadota bacterium]